MATNTTSLFLPEEHRVVSSWLEVEPRADLPEDLTLETALDNLGLNQKVSEHSTTDFAVAAILLESVQESLPQWGCVFKDRVELGRNYRDRAASRTVELTPRRLFTINWADSGPGMCWPEEYRVTYVPLYDVYVVTGSLDDEGAWGVTDVALGHFSSAENVVEAAGAIVQSEWRSMVEGYEFHRWGHVFDEGLIDTALAERLADEVWGRVDSAA